MPSSFSIVVLVFYSLFHFPRTTEPIANEHDSINEVWESYQNEVLNAFR